MTRKPKLDPEALVPLIPLTHLREPPAGTLRRGIALGANLQRSEGRLARVVRLLFDSAAQPLPAGIRSDLRADRRLLFELAGGDAPEQLDLRLAHAKAGLELAGQLLPPQPGAVLTIRAGRTARTVALGDAGEFVVRDLPGTARTLTLDLEWDGARALLTVPSERA